MRTAKSKPKKKPVKGKHPGGRPTKFTKKMARDTEMLCMMGATDQELADFFEINQDTVYQWKKNNPQFSEAIKRGKEGADMNVANRLYQRAMGYEHDEDVIMQYQGSPVVVKTKKHYPPDSTAAIFWLKNRRPKEWRDKHEIELKTKVDLTGLTEEELSLLEKIKLKSASE